MSWVLSTQKISNDKGKLNGADSCSIILKIWIYSVAGYARLSNVEFYHTGQEGFTEEYDPRFSVAYVATGTVSNVKPSKVTKCSFHNGFNTAVGSFGIGSLEVSENVVFGSIGNGKSEHVSVYRLDSSTLQQLFPTVETQTWDLALILVELVRSSRWSGFQC